ncbi:MAG: type 4a pilus biogenesis protein PilO [Trichloromonadaceae bacterium]
MARESLLVAAWHFNRKYPLIILGLLLLNLTVYFLMVYWVTPWVGGLERRFIEQQAQVRQTQQGLAALATPQTIFRRGQSDLQSFRDQVPLRSEFPALMSDLYLLAREAGLDIERITYDPKIPTEAELLRYGLVFAVAGDYGQVKRFVHSLEQSSRLIAIEEIALSAGENEQGQSSVLLRLRLSTYFKADPS